ncbi:MAG TPA: serine hydrolase [Solirubrobacteraceae bacterium]|jgi:D-alanyl-D-alanine carboxypeptidase|nr:serine hydrolase [Solirubrobacteraceae bacterium]
MPYQLLQGGTMRRRRSRRGRLLVSRLLPPMLIILLAGAGLWLMTDSTGEHSHAAPHRHLISEQSAVALDAGTAPLAGGGTTPSPLAVKLQGGVDAVHQRFRKPFGKAPRAGLLFDLDSGRVLWRYKPTKVAPIASLTKMMTALVVTDQLPARARVPVTRQALAYRGSGVGLLPRGKAIQLRTMLYGLLLPSGNDAAIALAQRAGGTVRRFVALMNARARAMGLLCTHFTSPSGFRDRGNHSCAADLAAIARAVLREPRLAPIVGARSAELPFPIKGGKLYLYNNNPLLRAAYPGTTGVKTGYTLAAGPCLVATAAHGGRRLGVVLLDSVNTGDQARRLLDKGFAALRHHR